ncbi:PDDEXK family nuclease, partial [Alkalihalophilus marmarensis]|nr:hypothetical protein [Alkalihalophilus marmarensis]
HYNFLLPIQQYTIKREEYFNKQNIDLPLEEFKKRRESIYQQLVVEGKANTRWKNEVELYKIALKLYPDAIYQYRSEWLETQSLDIFIPSLGLGIEFQGQQHYEPIEFFGGEQAFLHRKKLDALKLMKCNNNNVKLIQWNYKELITKTNLKRKIDSLK